MTTLIKASAIALGLSIFAAGAASPVSAASIPSQAATVSSNVEDGVIAVRETRRRSRQPTEDNTAQYGADTVGSIGYDGSAYGYNRVSGQRYQKCMEDLGYGRVRPCDAGDTQ
jgi:hypothetical protein